MRKGPKLALLFAFAALLAVGLSACGSDDSTDSTAASTPTTTQGPTATTTPDDNGGGGNQQSDDKGGASGSKSGDGGTGLSPDEESYDFVTPGGDNSIQTYGEEADSSELDEAGAALTAYLDHRAAGDWAQMCEDLSKATLKPLEQLASRAPQFKGKGCGAVLEALMGKASAATRANTLAGPIASLRVEGDRGFVLYHGAKGVDYFVPMAKEGGKWKVAAIAPSEFLG
jgi:hypothetical protein